MNRWMKRIAIGMAVVAGALGLVNPVLGTGNRPAPDRTPGYQVATIAVGHRPGPVTLHLWYPTKALKTPDLIAQNALFYGFHAQIGAAPDGAPHPVVILSHGSGGRAEQMGWLATQLAQDGMIVLAPDHPGTMSRDSDPFQTPMIWQRDRDLTAALDWLATNPIAGLQADLTRVASIGFSLGGPAALGIAGARLNKQAYVDFCARAQGAADCDWMTAAGVDFTQIDASLYEADWRDPRIIASVAIDPGLTPAMRPESLAAMDLPVLVIVQGSEGILTQAVRDADFANAMPQARVSEIASAWHFSFLPECSTLGWIVIGLAGEDSICSDWGLRPRADIHAEELSLILPFLQTTLFSR